MNVFSKTEQKIISIIGRKKISLKEITKEFYHQQREKVPVNGGVRIASAVRQIEMKCKLHDLKWKLDSKGTGRGGKVVWKAKV